MKDQQKIFSNLKRIILSAATTLPVPEIARAITESLTPAQSQQLQSQIYLVVGDPQTILYSPLQQLKERKKKRVSDDWGKKIVADLTAPIEERD